MPRRIVVEIRRNELSTAQTSVWPWEVAILNFIHPGGVKEVGEEHADNEVLDPASEFARLEKKYAFDKETHEVRVHKVYGTPPLGIDKLAEAMQKSLEEPTAEDEQPRARRRAAASS